MEPDNPGKLKGKKRKAESKIPERAKQVAQEKVI